MKPKTQACADHILEVLSGKPVTVRELHATMEATLIPPPGYPSKFVSSVLEAMRKRQVVRRIRRGHGERMHKWVAA